MKMKKTILSIESKVPNPEAGWLDIKLSQTAMDRLNQYISVANVSANVSVKNSLVGNISRSLALEDVENWFFDNCILELCTSYAQNFPTYQRAVLTKNAPFIMKTFWVNYMKQHEFNPIHDHEGVFSFVIFVNIPTDWKEQHDFPLSKESNDPSASDFSFVYTNMHGRIKTARFQLSSDSNGCMLFFPAELQHMVYPFYECEEERITISGNILYNINSTIRLTPKEFENQVSTPLDESDWRK